MFFISKVKQFTHTTIVYFFGSILTKLISFLLLPLYSAKLSTEAFGYFDYSVTILTILSGVVCFELWTGAIRFLLQKDTKEGKEKVIYNSIIMASTSIILLAVVFVASSSMITIQHAPLIFLYAVVYIFQSLYSSFIRGYKRNVDFMLSGLLSSIINMFINIYFIGYQNGGVEYLYISFICGALIQILYIEWKIKTFKTFHLYNFDAAFLKQLFTFCFPLFINSISYWVLTSYSRVVISNVLGLSANGVYSMGLRFSSIIVLFTSVLSMAWQELVFSNKTEKKRVYRTGLLLYGQFLLYGIIFALPVLKIIYPLMIDVKFVGALIILPICMLNTIISGYSDFIGKVIIAENKTKMILFSSFLGAITCFLLSNILVYRFSLVGVVCSIFIGFLISVMIRFYALRDIVFIKLNKQILSTMILLLVSILIYYFGNNIMNLISFLIMSIIIVLLNRKLLIAILKNFKRRNQDEENNDI